MVSASVSSRSAIGSATPRCPTRYGGWAGSRCASCRGTSASSARAAEAAERGLGVDALVGAMGAALAFDDSEDPQAVDLQRMLRERMPRRSRPR